MKRLNVSLDVTKDTKGQIIYYTELIDYLKEKYEYFNKVLPEDLEKSGICKHFPIKKN